MTTETTTPARTLFVSKDATFVALKEGRRNVWKLEGIEGLSRAALLGVCEAQDTQTVTQDDLETAIAKAKARRGSVIPDDYRVQYGVDQNCGDDVADKLRKRTTGPDGKCDMAAVEQVASENGMADDYDRWVSRGLNNGMVRMNLGNKLRAKARRNEQVAL